MKNFTLNRILIVLITGLFILGISCTEEDTDFASLNPGVSNDGDNGKEEDEDEPDEVVIDAPEALAIRSGEERIELEWDYPTDPNVVSYKIFWDNENSSLSGSFSGDDTQDPSVIITDLEERSYKFDVYQYDNEGNSSEKSTAQANVYGEQYRSGLINRPVEEINNLPDDELELIWGDSAGNGFLFAEIKYEDNTGEETIVKSEKEAASEILSNFPSGNGFEVRSAFIPEPTAIDTFYTDFQKIDLNPIQLSFDTNARFGTQPDQLSVWVSNDFDGVYEPSNVEAATWVNMSDGFTFDDDSVTDEEFTNSGVQNISDFIDTSKPFYVAFKYTHDPEKGTRKMWQIQRDPVVKSKTGDKEFDMDLSEFGTAIIGNHDPDKQYTHQYSTQVTLNGNAGDFANDPQTIWFISPALE